MVPNGKKAPVAPEDGRPDRLPAAAWRDRPETRAVIAALEAAGAGPRFVGGCVRDTLLGRPVADVDIATPLRPEAVMEALRRAGIRVVPTGLDHGTVTAVIGGQPFEITTLRIDVETDGRHAVVAFTDDWRADAARRDFTMNALSADPDGRIHDYFGGVEDALAGRVRFVGDPAQRMDEDVLRLLRLFRFHAHYGRTPIEPATLEAVRRFVPRIAGLSGERIRAELLKLLSAPDPATAWRVMAGLGVAEAVLGEPGDADRLESLSKIEPRPDPLLRLAALVTRADSAAALAQRLRLSNAERDRLLAAVRPIEGLAPEVTESHLVRTIYRHGRVCVVDRLLIAAAGEPEERRWPALAETARGVGVPAFPLQGRDIVGLGVPPGPKVGRLLAAVERWWLDGGLAAGREACLAEARRLVASARA